MKMKHEVIGRYGSGGEAMRDANELLDVVTNTGCMTDMWCRPIGMFMVGECAHQTVRYEWHAKNRKLIRFEERSETMLSELEFYKTIAEKAIDLLGGTFYNVGCAMGMYDDEAFDNADAQIIDGIEELSTNSLDAMQHGEDAYEEYCYEENIRENMKKGVN